MSEGPILRVRGLSAQVAAEAGAATVVDGLSFDVARGGTLCLAGESGSGKSMTAMALTGLLPRPMARVAGGSVRLGAEELTTLSERRWRRVRGGRIGIVFQEPMTSLNPVMRVGAQLVEALLEHGACPRAQAPGRAAAPLAEVRLPDPAGCLRRHPHELSGGTRQRVVIAMALAGEPDLLIADEPTTALDVTVEAEIPDLLRALQARRGVAMLLITQDMGVVAEMADRAIVLRRGRVEEAAPVRPLFAAPRSAHARDLLAAVPRLGEPRPARARAAPVLAVRDLSVTYGGGGVLRRREGARAVGGVSLEVSAGRTLALVGERGSGRSTIGRAVVGLVPWIGSVAVAGRETRGPGRAAMKVVRRDAQMVFQDPGASLDPCMIVGAQIAEPLLVHDAAEGAELRERAEWLLRRVGLPGDAGGRFPRELSGGQRQRVCIARALARRPKLIVADEPTSALDVSVRAQVLDPLAELQDEDGLTYLFVNRDMAVVDRVADEVAVLRRGRIVERGPRERVLHAPEHDYTRRLLAAVPVPDPTRARRTPSVA